MDAIFIVAFSCFSISVSLFSAVVWALRAANSLKPTDIAG